MLILLKKYNNLNIGKYRVIIVESVAFHECHYNRYFSDDRVFNITVTMSVGISCNKSTRTSINTFSDHI